MACVSIYKVARIRSMLQHYFQSIHFKINTIQLSQKKVKFYFPQINTKLKIAILRRWEESWKPAAFCALQAFLAKLPRTQQQILQGACCSIHSAKPQDQQRAQMEPSTCCTPFPGLQRRIWKAITVFPPTTTKPQDPEATETKAPAFSSATAPQGACKRQKSWRTLPSNSNSVKQFQQKMFLFLLFYYLIYLCRRMVLLLFSCYLVRFQD